MSALRLQFLCSLLHRHYRAIRFVSKEQQQLWPAAAAVAAQK
jgi:hypothetical protein